MAVTYVCKEVDVTGKVIQTTYLADNKEELIQMIRSKGHTPIKIEEEAPKGQDIGSMSIFEKKVKAKDISIFCKQLYVMLHAGMPLMNALDVLYHQSEHKTVQKTVKDMTISVQKGDILSVSMKKHPKVFPSLLISMVESGELTGNLDSVLERMSTHYTKENRINSKIKGAMVYPAVLGVLSITVVIFMITFILPTFTSMFTSSGVPLPGITQFLLDLSESIRKFWYIYLLVVFGLSFMIRRTVKTTSGKRAFDKLVNKIPVVKTQVAKIATSRFTRTLSTLLASGIPIIQALDTSAAVTTNMVVIDGIGKVTEDIKKGSSLHSLLKRIDMFPPMMVSMVGIGEESGALEDMLDKAADYYDEELEAAIQRLVQLLEPLMIVIMALMIGFIVIAMLLPMFDMYSLVG
ncbi:MAG TPA: type II secretion system protein F [Clostridiales bacterium UBA8960]|nr:type II secretion system protein F [Clostridiales bacterium UBA8960]